MKVTKIKISNLFGIKEQELDGNSVEITGKNGTGKTSVIDAIKYAFTNDSERDYIVRYGENEGEILVEADTGLTIDRKKRTNQSDYKSIRENGKDIHKPESFLSEIFTPLQLNPVEFTQMSRQEQNRIILDLIQFDWDLNFIKEQFGEIPEGVNYEQNILNVLFDIQKDDGVYFLERQNINRDIRNKNAFISDIAKDIPENYQAKKWEAYSLSDKYKELEGIRSENNLIERAKQFKESFDGKKRGLEAKRETDLAAEERAITSERENLKSTIARLKAELKATDEKLNSLDGKFEDKKKVVEAEYKEGLAKLDKQMGNAKEYLNKEPIETTSFKEEIEVAEAMKKHLNEYGRMVAMKKEVSELKEESEEYTRKIELARELPAQILREATIPVDGLTVENGIPLINGLPVSNLSDGEKLNLCIDIAISKPNSLQIILIDGTEKLSEANRKKLYQRCKDKGLQFIATRTTNDDVLEVTEL